MTPEAVIGYQPALPKLLLGDDHRLILDALGAMMKDQFDVLTVDSSWAFINAAEDFRPDVAILDVSMPGGDGFMAARKVLQRQPSLPIVFLSMYSDSSYVHQASQIGAKAYLSKSLPAQDLMSAIRAVLEGETLLDTIAPTDGKSKDDAAKEESGIKNELTGRQREVLRLIAVGCSAKEIANQLNISVRTAEFHRAAIMQRLGLHSTAQMTRYAIANDIA